MSEIYFFVILFLFCLGCSCLWSLSDIFSKPRFWVAKYFPSFFRKMLLCMECSAFWVGGTCSVFLSFFSSTFLVKSTYFDSSMAILYFVNFLVAGVINHILVKVLNNFDFFTKKNNNVNDIFN